MLQCENLREGVTVRRLGHGALRLSGPGVWGVPEDPDGAKAVLRRAVELGVNLIDTARREIRTLERSVILSTREEKRAGDVTFKESVTEGVCCLECTSVSTGGRQA